MSEDSPPSELDLTIRARVRVIRLRDDETGRLCEELSGWVQERWNRQHPPPPVEIVEVVVTPVVPDKKPRRRLIGWAQALRKKV